MTLAHEHINLSGYTVKDPDYPGHEWEIREGEVDVTVDRGSDWGDASRDDYGSGPWSDETFENAWLIATLELEDGTSKVMTLKGDEVVCFIGEDRLTDGVGI